MFLNPCITVRHNATFLFVWLCQLTFIDSDCFFHSHYRKYLYMYGILSGNNSIYVHRIPNGNIIG